jgi:DNA-binding response OmpR family regulator
MHILVIDDSSTQQKISKFYLEHVYGHKVSVATNGMDGIDMALSIDPDIIILDTCMPGLSGKNTLVVLRKIAHMRNIPVIMAGTEKDILMKDQFLSIGAAGFILKHNNMELLNEKISQLYGMDTRTA